MFVYEQPERFDVEVMGAASAPTS